MWQDYMVQKSSRGPRIIGHSNDKNQKFSGTPPRTPLRGRGAYSAPKPPAVLLLASLAFSCKQKLLFFHSLASKLQALHAFAPVLLRPCRRNFVCPQWTLGSHVRQKIMFAGHDVRQKNFRYFWAWVYTVRYRCLCIISASCLVTSHWTLETLENLVFLRNEWIRAISLLIHIVTSPMAVQLTPDNFDSQGTEEFGQS